MTGLIVLLFCGVGAAQDTGVDWDQLNDAEQRVLQRFSDRWDQLTPQQQQRLQNGARRWSIMKPEERDQAKERLQRWKQMSPQQRGVFRERYKKFKQLPPEERRLIRERVEKFRQLPAKERKAMRERWENLPLERRRAVKELAIFLVLWSIPFWIDPVMALCLWVLPPVVLSASRCSSSRQRRNPNKTVGSWRHCVREEEKTSLQPTD